LWNLQPSGLARRKNAPSTPPDASLQSKEQGTFIAGRYIAATAMLRLSKKSGRQVSLQLAATGLRNTCALANLDFILARIAFRPLVMKNTSAQVPRSGTAGINTSPTNPFHSIRGREPQSTCS
jgi:hypothetical protein